MAVENFLQLNKGNRFEFILGTISSMRGKTVSIESYEREAQKDGIDLVIGSKTYDVKHCRSDKHNINYDIVEYYEYDNKPGKRWQWAWLYQDKKIDGYLSVMCIQKGPNVLLDIFETPKAAIKDIHKYYFVWFLDGGDAFLNDVFNYEPEEFNNLLRKSEFWGKTDEDISYSCPSEMNVDYLKDKKTHKKIGVHKNYFMLIKDDFLCSIGKTLGVHRYNVLLRNLDAKKLEAKDCYYTQEEIEAAIDIKTFKQLQ